MSETTLRHIEHLTNTIGPRGTATPKEAEAHDYCQATLEGLGYEVHRETFLAPLSGWLPFALAEGIMLLAVALFVILGQGADANTGGLAAAFLALVALISFALQLAHRANPLEWFLPVDRSQNVWAVARPSGEERGRVVVSGHVDTARTALAMQSPGMWQAFRVLVPIFGLANLALLGLFIWGMVNPDPLVRSLALYLAIVPVIALVFTLQPDMMPFVKGANDNASGAAAVLALAERLKTEPLRHTAVFLVNTGAEEVGSYGIVDWIERHADDDAPDADYLVLDNIAGKGSEVNYVVDESLLLTVAADPDLVELAGKVAEENSALGAKPTHYRGLFSELTLASLHGQSALGLLDFDPQTGIPPHFHTDRDDMSNIDPAVLERSEQFAWAILKEIDGDADELEAVAASGVAASGVAASGVATGAAAAGADSEPAAEAAVDTAAPAQSIAPSVGAAKTVIAAESVAEKQSDSPTPTSAAPETPAESGG